MHRFRSRINAELLGAFRSRNCRRGGTFGCRKPCQRADQCEFRTRMETVFVKIIAAALAFSQVAVTPDAVKTEFSRDKDERQVVELLRAGCTHMIEAFAIENISIDDLIETAMNDPQAPGGESKEFRGLNFGDLHRAYRQFCKHQEIGRPV